ncbi:glutathione S-transferase [Roseomonas sp. OT10]|uniref:glutathione S-transferase n=1 Tax=Roseomonas cutis TaxID=2897332 RepID=UPI001E2B0C04|nr:glutathione S-transferase [Roseomonas sp. OT10]UFN49325.1 glutathione S-transferase [Roseomonas sp. OT10]
MKLFHSPLSPFVRKVRIVAIEGGLADRLELVSAAAHPVDRSEAIAVANPLAKIPTLVLDDGTALYDSRVIAEYLDTLGGAGLVPAAGPARWQALTLQSLADGVADAALLARYENSVREPAQRHAGWLAGQMAKVTAGLDEAARQAPGFGDRLDIGTIALGCTLGYLDLRFPELGWRQGREALAAWFEGISGRPSFRDTAPAT